jgi:hypothetical protein
MSPRRVLREQLSREMEGDTSPMSRNRHSDENRVTPETPAETRCMVELLRRRATRRKLVLLECAIIRHAPFADCGRPLWDLMAEQPWFEIVLPPAEYFRYRATGDAPSVVPGSDQPWPSSRVNGHHAIEWLEQHAGGTAGDDQLLIAEEYFHHAKWAAEADRFDTPDERRDELEIRYGAAYWLNSLRELGPELWNILDYYLANFPGKFYRWAGSRPFHVDHRAVAVGLIDDILGHSLQSFRFDPDWRTADPVAIASAMYETRDFSPAPILADTLEDVGCDNADVLAHCRVERQHCRGCWVVDLVLGKE